MSLKSHIRSATRQTLRAAKSLRETITYVSIVPGTYNATTDKITNKDVSYPKLSAYPSYYSVKEIVGDVEAVDERLTLEKAHLSFEPKKNDHVIRAGVKAGRWDIKDVKVDQSGSLVIMRVRQP